MPLSRSRDPLDRDLAEEHAPGHRPGQVAREPGLDGARPVQLVELLGSETDVERSQVAPTAAAWCELR